MEPEFQAYVGPQSFKEKDKDIFFGRSRESRDLRSLVIAHNLVVVYAQSGAGKTSLINAGLIPLLKENKFEVLPVARVLSPPLKKIRSEEILNIFVFNTLTSLAAGVYDAERLAKMKLVDFLNEEKHKHDKDGLPLPRAVIFDQFEEIFSLYQDRWKDRKNFFEQVSVALKADPLLSVVFVMREDFIAQLDPYVDLLPERLRTRFHLERLRREAALLAIKEPVKKAGRCFAEGVAEKLVDDLMNIRVEAIPGKIAEVPGEFIEAVQLQLVCHKLWKELPPSEKQITFQHLKTYGNVGQELYTFYEEAIRAATEKVHIGEEDLRRLCGEVLITEAGTRGIVYRSQESTGGVPNVGIDVLESMHLIRAEWRAGARWYELTHDRFIEPIQSSNKVFNDKLAEKEREEKERAEKAKAEKELAAEKERAEKEREEKERAEKELRVEKELAKSRRRFNIVLSAFSIIFLIISVVAAYEWNDANNQKEIAEKKTLEVENQKHILEASYLNSKSQNLQEYHPTLDKSVPLAIESRNISRTLDDKKLRQELLLDSDKLIRQGLLLQPHGFVALNYDVPIVPITTKVSFSPDGKYVATASRDNKSRIWVAATGKQVFVLNHTKWVQDVVFSPDGKYVATASDDNTACIWNASTGKQIFVLNHNGPVYNLVFSPNGKYIATASGDKTAHIWDLNGTSKNVLKHNNAVNRIRFSPDGKYVATTTYSNVSIWDTFKGEEPIATPNVSGNVLDVTFSPDGKKVAVASDDEASIWDAFNGEKLLANMNHTDEVRNVTFSPNGEKLATASRDRTARLWDAATGKQVFVIKHDYALTNVSFSPDGKFIATSSEDETACLWDAATGKRISVMNHNSGVNGVVFSPDGKYVATTSNNETYIWDANAEIPILNHIDSVKTIAFSRDGKYVATASSDNTARVWDVATGKQIFVLEHHGPVNDVVFSPDGKYVATASRDYTAHLWDAATGKQVFAMNHTDKVNKIRFSSDGKYVATASDDETSRIWDVATGKKLKDLKCGGKVVDVMFSPNVKYVATAGKENTSRIWDWNGTGENIPLNHKDWVNKIVFSPDGAYVATASFDKTARIWDALKGEEPLATLNFTRRVFDIAFSPNGSLVAVASWDKNVSIWNWNNATVGHVPLNNLTHDGYMFRVVFSPDGEYIATTNGRMALVWSVSTGEKIAAIAHDGVVNDVIFSPDGKYIATASDDNTARLYRFDIKELINEASHCLTRNLAPEEWKKYMGDKPRNKTFPNLP